MVGVWLSLIVAGVQAQVAGIPASAAQTKLAAVPVPAPTAYRVVDRGANHKVWQRETYEPGLNGKYTTRVHQYVELAAGMHYKNSQGQWTESREKIEIFAGGAIARQGAYQVMFAGNLNSAGAIDEQTPDGKRLRSNILGLSYYDSSTGRSVLLAQVQNAQGELIGANQVLYQNAFAGVLADVRYTYKKGKFEQDVILREQPPTPESLGLNPATTEIEVMTEFINPPPATVKQPPGRHQGWEDSSVSWGAMHLGQGKAFDLGGPKNLRQPVPVQRQYDVIKGRHILLESVPVKNIQAGLQTLPLQSSVQKSLPVLASQTRVLPATPLAQANGQPMKLAADLPAHQGFVLDYVEIDVDQDDYTFQGDMTYYISDVINFSGVVTIEGGTVIKFNTNNGCALNILGTLDCRTAAYRPAVFTSANDSSIGESVGAGSLPPCTGSLDLQVVNASGWNLNVNIYDDNWNTPASGTVPAYGSADLGFTAGLGQHYYFEAYDDNWDCYYWFDFYPTLNSGTASLASDGWSGSYSETGVSLCTPPATGPVVALSLANGGAVHDVRIENVGVGISSAGNYSVMNAQFLNCGTALDTENATLYAGNVLMSQVGTAFYGQYFQATAENVTFDQGALVTDDQVDTSSTVTLVNSLVTAVTGYGVVPVSTAQVVALSDNTGIYQTVGGGGYYLATGSPYHNAGTTGINPGLLAVLSQKTTYPPTVYAGSAFTDPLNLAPQAQRDNIGYPDLGYHYDPLDYVFGGCDLYANLTLAPGTAAAWYEDYGSVNPCGQPYGLSLNDGATLAFNGSAMQPSWLAHFNLVQESVNGNWGNHGWMSGLVLNGSGSGVMPQINAQFTKWTCPNVIAGYFRDSWAFGVVNLTHCEFYNSVFCSYRPSVYATNCLFFRIGISLWDQCDAASVTFQNCTFYNGGLTLCRFSGQSPSCWTIRNTTFDGTGFDGVDNYNGDTNYTAFDYNAYNAANTSWQTNPFMFTPIYGTLETVGPHDVTVTSGYNWQTSWLGSFYLPPGSPLIDHGNPTADQVGLYHFTTQTNQVPETNSIVDIGYHYVAVDGNGNPLATLWFGLPDYLADTNGELAAWEMYYFGHLGLDPNASCVCSPVIAAAAE